MINVLLIHAGRIPHYRVPIYGFLGDYLKKFNFALTVIADGIQPDNPHEVGFEYAEMPLSALRIALFAHQRKMDVVIDYMELRHLYLFPTYLFVKFILGRKMIYWGQGIDLADTGSRIKNFAYALEQSMCDALILYAEHLKRYVPVRFHERTFIANNTLFVDYAGLPDGVTKRDILDKYGIQTPKNVICMGRMQKRKRLEILVTALAKLNRKDIGLILVGPDTENVLDNIVGENIYKLGPIYGDEKFDLLSAADIYCLPGAVGLSIIDAFHCGLPFVTEEGDESAEITYLKDGVNGFIVQRGNIEAMAEKILLLLDNEEHRQEFSREARKEILENGSIEKMCAGFKEALCHVTR